MTRKDKRTDNVLASGEQTGHAHRAAGDGVVVYGESEDRILEAPHGAIITHEEHGPQTLDAGEYDVTRVKEFDPFAEAIRSVQD